jgi:excisionase family DNA binding protein
MSTNKQERKDELMTADELAAYLHFSAKTIYNMVKEKTLPAIRIGDNLRFSRPEIDAILQQPNKAMINILVIDNAETVCSVMRKVLENEGHMVITSTTGAEGLEHLVEIKFDHIFLDLCISDISGLETLRRIREADPAVPVTIITGQPESGVVQQAKLYEIKKVIRKPFSTRDLLTAISS